MQNPQKVFKKALKQAKTTDFCAKKQFFEKNSTG